MQPFFSILMTPIRPAIKEQVSVALILISENKVFFKYSAEKLSFLKKLIPSDVSEMLKQYLAGLSNKISTMQDDLSDEYLLIRPTTKDFNFLSDKYLSDLSAYSNNLITFSKPAIIDIETSEQSFNLLFEKFVSDEYTKNLADELLSNIEILRKDFYPKIQNRVNFDVDINKIIKEEKKVPISVLPEHINIFGKNGKYVTAQVIDFDKKSNNLKADLSFYINFINEFDGDNSHFIIGNEPEKSQQKNNQYWDDVRKFKKNLQYVPFKEVEIISNYLEKNDVKPVF
ncbi:MAG: hypothetical protein ABFD00_00790 [Chloroherpetonaceae bacterium]